MPTQELPQHVAIIMDGNGRWAESRGLSRSDGHEAGYKALRQIVEKAAELELKTLSVFAFSTENWRRPDDEIQALMSLFLLALESEADSLFSNNVRLKFIGDLSGFSSELQIKIQEVEARTEKNTGLNFVVAVNYGGRWDVMQACKTLCHQVEAGEKAIDELVESDLSGVLSTAEFGDPDLFIRTSGETRISNFFLWQLAYAELYFTQKYWPDFSVDDFQEALQSFGQRERRFGDVKAKGGAHA